MAGAPLRPEARADMEHEDRNDGARPERGRRRRCTALAAVAVSGLVGLGACASGSADTLTDASAQETANGRDTTTTERRTTTTRRPTTTRPTTTVTTAPPTTAPP